MGYVCLGHNIACDSDIRPTAYDILVGLNYGFDTTRNESGQIYFKTLSSDSIEFGSAKLCVNLYNPNFMPKNIAMITYDRVLSYDLTSNSKASFQVFLLTDSIQSYVIFKFILCPSDLTIKAPSGLNLKLDTTALKEVSIDNNQQCTLSNVGQMGVWVIEATNTTTSN